MAKKKLKPAAPPKRRQSRTIDKKPAFLQAYIKCADLTRAAAAVKMDRSNHYQWLDDDPKYKAAFERARIQAGQTLEDDAVNWARKGIFEPLVYQGRFQYVQKPVKMHELADGRTVREEQLPEDKTGFEIQKSWVVWEDDIGKPLGIWRRSEGMMGKALKAFMPERYGDRVSAELSGPGGGPIESEHRVIFVKPTPAS
jgi:hypothetical protein